MIINDKKGTLFLIITVISALMVFNEYTSSLGIIGGLIGFLGVSDPTRTLPPNFLFFGRCISVITIIFSCYIFLFHFILVDFLSHAISILFF